MPTPVIIDDPEKGTSELLEVLSPLRPQTDEKALPSVSVSVAIPSTKGFVTPKPSKRKVSRWVRFQLWFNTYRSVINLSIKSHKLM
ncbi:hypothetical protein PHLCEN_2v10401 [Hermanssonia centrifuga]|uniref:Uncharacterized protein n=1 Tax=Hermanssonia centrifuga TaxID=98765 RepID=A0A2R6NMZ5_9APHY|nr:hypothetical protein PHLCEN_2v10401 [Hermanssonia centrifuga]